MTRSLILCVTLFSLIYLTSGAGKHKKTAAKPVTSKLAGNKTTAKPETSKVAGNKTTAKPATPKATTAKAVTKKPTTAHATTAKPTQAKPTTKAPKPTTARPVTKGKHPKPAPHKSSSELPVWSIVVVGVVVVLLLMVLINIVLCLRYRKGAFQTCREKCCVKDQSDYQPVLNDVEKKEVDTEAAVSYGTLQE